MKLKRFAIVLSLLLVMLVPAGAALASPPFDTRVTTGETINNDVIVFDGDVEVEEGATVNGSVTVFNGDAYVAGMVDGDLVLFNGNLNAASTAVITGDCVLLNGRLEDSTETGLNCTDVESLPNFIPALSSLPRLPSLLEQSDIRIETRSGTSRFFGNLAQAAGRSLLLGLLAFVAATLMPKHLTQVGDAVRRKPAASGAVGLLTAVAVPSLVVLLVPISIILTFVCVGLLGFPLMFLLMLSLGAGALLGWIAVGNMVGERLADPLKLKNRTLPVTAVMGTVLLTFVIGLMGLGEGVISFLVVCFGLGATALTKFGTRSYPFVAGVNGDKVSAILDTLPVEDPADLK